MASPARQELKLMVWNIQVLGKTKAKCNTIIDVIADTIIAYDIDLFIIVELVNLGAIASIQKTLNAITAIRGVAGYKTYYFSPKSNTAGYYSENKSTSVHGEYYGFIIKDTAAIAPFGFADPLTHDWRQTKDSQCFYDPEDDFNVFNANLKQLTDTTSYDDDSTYKNSFYLYDRTFPVGRPPCWAQFKFNNEILNILVVHLTPNYKLAIQQVKSLTKSKLVTDESINLIICGDFNIDFGLISARNVQDDDQMIAQKHVLTLLEPLTNNSLTNTFKRRAQATHINGSTYDDFIQRVNGSCIPVVVSPKRVLEILSEKFNAYTDLSNFVDSYKNKAKIIKLLDKFLLKGGKLTDEETYTIFSLISDHFPIILKVNL